jgi:hypothetical protein
MAKKPIRSPDPKRVAVGRQNHLKRKGLTDAGRERLRQSALKHQPWKHSTGPRTAEGKAKVAEARRRCRRGSLSCRDRQQQLSWVEQLIDQMVASRRLAIAIAALK